MIRFAWAAAFLLTAVLAAGMARAEAPLWKVDLEASRVGFTAGQMQVKIPGRFPRFTATIHFAADDLAASAVQVIIDIASVETPNQDVETEIKRDSWFDVARFPEARFETTRIEHREGDRYDALALLTMRDVTLPVTLPLTIAIADDPDHPGGLRARATGDIPVSRTAFGIGQGQWADVGVVSDIVVIHIDIVARRPKP